MTWECFWRNLVAGGTPHRNMENKWSNDEVANPFWTSIGLIS